MYQYTKMIEIVTTKSLCLKASAQSHQMHSLHLHAAWVLKRFSFPPKISDYRFRLVSDCPRVPLPTHTRDKSLFYPHGHKRSLPIQKEGVVLRDPSPDLRGIPARFFFGGGGDGSFIEGVLVWCGMGVGSFGESVSTHSGLNWTEQNRTERTWTAGRRERRISYTQCRRRPSYSS